jgi:hypothetical protein
MKNIIVHPDIVGFNKCNDWGQRYTKLVYEFSLRDKISPSEIGCPHYSFEISDENLTLFVLKYSEFILHIID